MNLSLRMERLRKGWSQQQLADFSQVSLSTVARAERGLPIRVDCIQRISECLGRTPEQLELVKIELGDKRSIVVNSHHFQESELKTGNERDGKVELPLPQQNRHKPTKFLNMEPEKLIERYAGEEEHFLRVRAGSIDWTMPQVVVFDNSLWHLPITAIHIEVDKQYPEYIIPVQLEGKAKDVLEEIGSYFHDSTAIRLNRIEVEDRQITLFVSKVSYLQYVATNYAMDALLSEKGWTRSLRDSVHPADRLCKLEESLLANHIGVGTLLFTLDNYLVLSSRPDNRIGIWHQQITPSISGATSYDDDMYSMKSGPVSSWMREGREELGISNSDFVEGSDIFLGITRELLRGGKPEMFFAARLALTKAKLEQKFRWAKDAWESKEFKWFEFASPLTPPTTGKEQATFLREFEELLRQYKTLLAPPAQANLALWYKYMLSL